MYVTADFWTKLKNMLFLYFKSDGSLVFLCLKISKSSLYSTPLSTLKEFSHERVSLAKPVISYGQ